MLSHIGSITKSALLFYPRPRSQTAPISTYNRTGRNPHVHQYESFVNSSIKRSIIFSCFSCTACCNRSRVCDLNFLSRSSPYGPNVIREISGCESAITLSVSFGTFSPDSRIRFLCCIFIVTLFFIGHATEEREFRGIRMKCVAAGERRLRGACMKSVSTSMTGSNLSQFRMTSYFAFPHPSLIWFIAGSSMRSRHISPNSICSGRLTRSKRSSDIAVLCCAVCEEL